MPPENNPNMLANTLRRLLAQDIIRPEEADRIALTEAKRLFSLHWELKTLLYLGVLMLNVGFGFLVYENIDSIGHSLLIAAIGAISVVCFGYAYRHRAPFSAGETRSPTPYYDYILLLGCLAFLIVEGYAQYQYGIFGTRYGLATLIPMLLFFGLAYWLDNRGVLTLGITALASWLGVTLAPQELLRQNDFNSETLVLMGVFLGALLTFIPFWSEKKRFKAHFSLTYLNFGIHLGMISALAGMIALGKHWLYAPIWLVGILFYLWYARTRHSFYFLTMSVVYGYIGFTYLTFTLMDKISTNWASNFYLFYFMASCAGVILFLTNYKRFLKKDAA